MRRPWILACLMFGCADQSVSQVTLACGPTALAGLDRIHQVPPFQFRGRGVAWVSDSSWVVLDEDDKQGVVVQRDGSESQRFGREGGGPGEFRSVSRVLVDADSGFVVAGYGRLVHFAFDGSLRGEVTLPGMNLSLSAWNGVTVTASFVDMLRGPVVTEANLATQTYVELFQPFAVNPSLKSELMPGMGNPFVPIGGSPDGRLVVGSVVEYRLLEFDRDGKVVGTLGRPEIGIQYRTDEEKAALPAHFGKLFKNFPQVRSVIPEVAKMFEGIPKPPFTGLTFDPEGNLWLILEAQDDSSGFDLLNPEGHYIGSVVFPHRVLNLGFRGGQMAVLFETVGGPFDGQHAIDVYRFEVSDCVVETAEKPAS